MATIQKNLEMVNFVCKFGDADLLDLFDEVVYPAFFNLNNKRKFRGSEYYFKNVELLDLGKDPLGTKNLIAIAGRFIKNTELSREQYENDKGELIRDTQGMPSAPSAIFVLMLNSHRLLYVAETKFAPNLNTFKATVDSFFRSEKNKYNKKLDRDEQAKFKVRFGSPEITITPLSTEKNVFDHLRQFEKIKKVKVTLNDRNSEFNASKMFDDIHLATKKMNSTTSVEFKNLKEGLDKEETPKEIAAALKQDNQVVKVEGITQDGENLTLSNEDFKLQKKINLVQENVKKTVSNMVAAFKNVVKSGDVTVKKTDTKTQTILDKIEPKSITIVKNEEETG
ncbi:hypothetical protein [Acinetobacter oleivorans]|uniref:Uncharacterized protein n=1 Tax=Acinetobacter oleivorans (strain JCM 16667 / KCTC 23045 / DR1) TaxID=436717 RepID=A0AAN0PAR5_ACISD|nr:hypothetical protein [Acinetobacter oleivorans]ADI91857.1 hypothetical protein AOLE_14850 [Acinetobacter oleivorans DR1]ESK44689.1 hypothetical protein P254_02213 [Acinetobacter oleivorans CIP 110421]